MSAALKPSPALIHCTDTVNNSLSQARSIAHVLSVCEEASADVQQAAWAIRDLVDAASKAHAEIWRQIAGDAS